MAIKINENGTTTKLGNAPREKTKTYHIYIVQDDDLTKFFITSEKYHLSRIKSKAKREYFNEPTIDLLHTLEGTLGEAKKIKIKLEQLFESTLDSVNECLDLSKKHSISAAK